MTRKAKRKAKTTVVPPSSNGVDRELRLVKTLDDMVQEYEKKLVQIGKLKNEACDLQSQAVKLGFVLIDHRAIPLHGGGVGHE